MTATDQPRAAQGCQATHMLFGAGFFAAGFLAAFLSFFFVAAYALSKLPMAGRMTAAPKPAIMAARISFLTASLHFSNTGERIDLLQFAHNQEEY